MQITLDDLSFGYSRRSLVFDGVSVDLKHFPLAVLGPNGAGKSTLLALLAGWLLPTGGAISVHPTSGVSASRSRDLRRVTSLMPQDIRPIFGLTARDQVAYSGWLKGMPTRRSYDAAQHALGMVGLGSRAKFGVSRLSGGQRRRVGIASAAISSPAVLLLDEPQAGLDPEQRGSVRSALRSLDGVALVISTHQTDDLDDFYEGVLVIDEGRVVFSGTSKDFLREVPPGTPETDRAEYAYRAVVKRHER